MSWLEKDTRWMQRTGGRNSPYFHHHRVSHQFRIFFLQDLKHACCLVWDMKDLVSAFMCVNPAVFPSLHSTAGLYLPLRLTKGSRISSFIYMCAPTDMNTHILTFFPFPQKSSKAKRSLRIYQQRRLIDIFSVSLLMPSGTDKAERNNNFLAWQPIFRAAGQWQNIWSSVRAPSKN